MTLCLGWCSNFIFNIWAFILFDFSTEVWSDPTGSTPVRVVVDITEMTDISGKCNNEANPSGPLNFRRRKVTVSSPSGQCSCRASFVVFRSVKVLPKTFQAWTIFCAYYGIKMPMKVVLIMYEDWRVFCIVQGRCRWSLSVIHEWGWISDVHSTASIEFRKWLNIGFGIIINKIGLRPTSMIVAARIRPFASRWVCIFTVPALSLRDCLWRALLWAFRPNPRIIWVARLVKRYF